MLKAGNPSIRNPEVPHGATNPIQREVALNQFMEFKGVFFGSRLLKAISDLGFVCLDFIPESVLVDSLREKGKMGPGSRFVRTLDAQIPHGPAAVAATYVSPRREPWE